jgi:hypothetical protein
VLCFTVGDLDFEHFRETGKEISLHGTVGPASVGRGKRKSTFDDRFSDVEIDEFELDEDDMKQLEKIESPEKLPNGNYKCNHTCKDRTKYCFCPSNIAN